GAKIFNCGWDDAPYIFYQRPDLRFVDILDPSLLYAHSPVLFQNRVGLNDGKIPDAYAALKAVFKADYVLCHHSYRLTALLDTHPDAVRVFPQHGDDASGLALYQLAPDRAAAQVRAFDLRFWASGSLRSNLPPDLAALPAPHPWVGDGADEEARSLFV